MAIGCAEALEIIQENINEELYDLRNNIEEMRECGETDLRSVLYHIDTSISNINKLWR